MKGKNHLLTGGATIATMLVLTTLETGIASKGLGTVSAFLKLDILGATLLGSLLPDIDADASAISTFFKNTNKTYGVLGKRILVFLMIAFSFNSIIPPVIFLLGLYGVRWFYFIRNKSKEDRDHRALPHSIWGLLGFGSAVYLLEAVSGLTLLVPFIVTYVLHLFFDCFTMQGIPIFGFTSRARHIRMPKLLCYRSVPSLNPFMTPKKEALIAYSYAFVIGLPISYPIIKKAVNMLFL